MVEKAAQIIKDGGVVAFPTETVYGLGADASNEAAISKVFSIKGRPSNNPLIVHVANKQAAIKLLDLAGERLLINRFEKLSKLWPGPISIVAPKADVISDLVTGGSKNIAVRVPDNEIALQLLLEAGTPIAAPSANLSGQLSPTKSEHVTKYLGDKIDLVLDGGDCKVGLESTVVSIVGENVAILRPGAITKENLEEVLNETVLDHSKHVSKSNSEILSSPGLLESHYRPRTPLYFERDVEPMNLTAQKIARVYLDGRKNRELSGQVIREVSLSETGNLNESAANLFSTLHELDELGLDAIIIDSTEDQGIGAALMNRLNRACFKGNN